ncbi:MAG: 1-acyl-sn-glycerol-3-phosphate acyltransferase, partial [Planctomycetaceae bacterium]|nr:1-acyl-sn-glycerol-3-phosphate acyltransferase [Planctomycetaceae bacterium]
MEKSPSSNSLGICRRLARRSVQLYYGKIEVTGAEKVPQTEPLLICANHANSLLDPVLVGVAVGRPVRFMAKAPLFDAPVLGPLMRALGMIPAFRGQDDQKQVRRNLESLDAGAKVLAEGDAMGIFPEGKSHDLQTVEMIRSGAARMALQAVEDGAKGLKVLPIGINYEDKERFRSAVWIRVGQPIDVSACLTENNNEERKARRDLTERLEQGLKDVVIHLDDAAWQPFLEDLEVLVPRDSKAKQETIYPLRERKWLADAMNHFQKNGASQAAEIATAIVDYRKDVQAAGVDVHSPVLQSSGWRMVLTLAWQSLWMLLLFLPALVGTLFHVVPFTVVRFIAGKLQPPGRPTVSMYRLFVGLPTYLLWYLAVGWWLFFDFQATKWFAWVCLGTLPFLGLLALGYWRATRDTAGLWWHQFQFLFHRDQLNALRRQRDELSQRLARLGDEYSQITPRPESPPKAGWGERLRPLVGPAVILLATLAFGWYVPRLFFDESLMAREAGFDLTTLSEKKLHAEMERDENSLHAIIQGLDKLEIEAHQLQSEFV